ncbi:hypothetical protein UlMin_035759 [Ulmus minor]
MDSSGIAPSDVSCKLVFDSPEDGRVAGGDEGKDLSGCSASTSSSIGKNSDLSERSSSDGEDCEENEAQSSYKGPLEMMEALEEVLPVRRGISKFYNGKSKSFTSLMEACDSPSIKDIVKPENAYTRKRRNLLAFSHIWEKNRSFPLRSNGGGISKRPISASRSTLALVMAMTSSDSSGNTSEDSNSNSSSRSRSPPPLPPLHPHAKASHKNAASLSSSPRRNFAASRSFSLFDLQQ